MKLMNKSMILMFALLSIGSSLLGYDWIINNKTEKNIMTHLQLLGGYSGRYWQLAAPGQRAVHPMWGPQAGHCKTDRGIEVTEYNENDPKAPKGLKTGLDYGDHSPQNVKDYFDKIVWHVPKIIFPKSEFDYEKVVNFIKSFGKPLQAGAEAIGASQGIPVPDLGIADFIGSLTSLIIEGVTKGNCTSMTLDLYEVVPPAQGRTVYNNPKILELMTLKDALKDLIYHKDAGQWRLGPIRAAIALAEKNKDLLGTEVFTSMNGDLKAGKNLAAMEKLNAFLKKTIEGSPKTVETPASTSTENRFVLINRVN